MKTINRLMTNICSSKLEESTEFYTKLFDLTVEFESDWFVHLVSKEKGFELGIIDRKNDLVPLEYQQIPQGFYMTFVVNDVDELFKIAVAENLAFVKEPHDTFYGQRRLLLKDPDGSLVDVSSLI